MEFIYLVNLRFRLVFEHTDFAIVNFDKDESEPKPEAETDQTFTFVSGNLLLAFEPGPGYRLLS